VKRETRHQCQVRPPPRRAGGLGQVGALAQATAADGQHEQEIRLDAIQRSSAVTRGKVTEHIVPYLPGFDLDPKDIRFLGTPIDLIAFKGLNGSEEIEIVFIEVKTGRSVLSARGRAVKKAVEEKKVSWRVFNPDLEIDHQRIPTTSKGSPLGVRAAAL
jgi:predicted Holliday junction resolvase-like endonuclease